MSTYEPGTVAKVTNGDQEHLALRVSYPADDWISVTDGGLYDVRDVRPLVVLDLKHPQGFVDALHEAIDLATDRHLAPLVELHKQIEAQTKPPKPEEPTGLGAVVEERPKPGHDRGELWIRTCVPCDDCLNKPWASGPMRRNWHIVDAVRVLSEGVSDAS